MLWRKDGQRHSKASENRAINGRRRTSLNQGCLGVQILDTTAVCSSRIGREFVDSSPVGGGQPERWPGGGLLRPSALQRLNIVAYRLIEGLGVDGDATGQLLLRVAMLDAEFR
jgi:hypothetical protein